MTFYDIIEKHDPKLVLQEIKSMTAADVQRALAAEQLDNRDFMALLSILTQWHERLCNISGFIKHGHYK